MELTPNNKKELYVESSNIVDNSVAIAQSNISRANQLIGEIEAIIQKELSLLSDDNFIAKDYSPMPSPVPKHKRKNRAGPKLIKPLNKKKNRIRIGEMEFDPVKNIWVGNERELSVFHRVQPALIANMGKNQVQVIGDMVFDPVAQKWIGNDKDLAKFGSTARPALISQLKPANEKIEKNGMVFDPEEMVWKGNEDVLDIFDHISNDEGEKRSFQVGKEFSLSPETIEIFRSCQQKHTESLSGWFAIDNDKNTKSHLNAIRTMSIAKIINQVRNGGPGSSPRPISKLLNEELPINAIHSNPMLNDIKFKSPPMSSEEDDDWSDIDVNPQMKLKSHNLMASKLKNIGSASPKHVNSENEEKEQSLDDIQDLSEGDDFKLKTRARSRSTPSASISSNKNPMLSKFQDQDENFDGDLDLDENVDSFHTPNRSIDPPSTLNSGSSKEQVKLSLSSDDDTANDDDGEWEGLEIKNTSKISLKTSQANDDDEPFWDSGNEKEKDNRRSSRSDSMESTGASSFFADSRSDSPRLSEAEEEDWPEIEIPSNDQLVSKLQKLKYQQVNTLISNNNKIVLKSGGNRSSSHQAALSEDEFSGIDFPENENFLFEKKARRNSSASEEGDSEKENMKTMKTNRERDDDWGDLEVPDDFATKFGSKSFVSPLKGTGTDSDVLKPNLY